ncbi:hypothetical protein AQUCO_05300121v1 [Aquilegia coerulea]|uniref:Uncharacterized protein n=1 Tax=Aquilegia coerulea TaxID=218851 RepID=A0A2G5CIF6_AQUCA|nr:hypothetical protein AQUCO_05300121v1 [Aquilegia coerulea]
MEAKVAKAFALIIMLVMVASPAMAGFPNCNRKCRAACQACGEKHSDCNLICVGNCLSVPTIPYRCNPPPAGEVKV